MHPIVPPIDWGAVSRDLAKAGRGAVAIGGRALGVAGGLLFPSNGLWNTKPGECYGTLTCAARPVYNENPENALDADATKAEDLQGRLGQESRGRSYERPVPRCKTEHNSNHAEW